MPVLHKTRGPSSVLLLLLPVQVRPLQAVGLQQAAGRHHELPLQQSRGRLGLVPLEADGAEDAPWVSLDPLQQLLVPSSADLEALCLEAAHRAPAKHKATAVLLLPALLAALATFGVPQGRLDSDDRFVVRPEGGGTVIHGGGEVELLVADWRGQVKLLVYVVHGRVLGLYLLQAGAVAAVRLQSEEHGLADVEEATSLTH